MRSRRLMSVNNGEVDMRGKGNGGAQWWDEEKERGVKIRESPSAKFPLCVGEAQHSGVTVAGWRECHLPLSVLDSLQSSSSTPNSLTPVASRYFNMSPSLHPLHLLLDSSPFVETCTLDVERSSLFSRLMVSCPQICVKIMFRISLM